jgi:hypothetical protein
MKESNYNIHDSMDRFAVQVYDHYKGWDTWCIYDEEIHAINECNRRMNEGPKYHRNKWRVSRCK